ncbi:MULTISPECIES: Fur family transcriptional regulator [Legionella]|uniref:Fur family transcriptional regulator n=1 Tax=Legionella TaxID=445 RepID=UPI000F8C9C38|nr:MULTISPECIES: Fur family transcriptional regulator [Legionella]MCP0913724.1 transcriptional repressor [Legionella sp. 27cVA30]RUQ99326.1 transcriptional repressor [Legionella septentrionalis]RUR09621.1 transcriptional repressor [Legionella septentrionalis]RUR14803.1 transcriptional repressor [Legionella septentrionalis]
MSYPVSFLEYCTLLNLRLTSMRKEILYILWQAKKPLKAYEILEALLKINPNAKPPTVYRALLFFVTQNMVHKIESIQSYTLCSEPEKNLFSEVLMVCNSCHEVVETYDAMMQALVLNIAAKNDFKLKQHVIELKGVCHKCAV